MDTIVLDSRNMERIANIVMGSKVSNLLIDSIVFTTDIPEKEVIQILEHFQKRNLVTIDEAKETVSIVKK